VNEHAAAKVVFTIFRLADYEEVVALWQLTEGMGLSAADSKERIGVYLERNPGLSFVAKVSGEVVGAVLAGHDGRRGYLHHLAVRSDWRGRGLGRALVERCLEVLRQTGIDKCHLFVYRANQPGQDFWAHEGWKERLELVLMSKDI
jgi:ribosomal protein S18 acetylase RimI-like enzyme